MTANGPGSTTSAGAGLGIYVSQVSPESPDVEPIEVFKPSQLSVYLLGVASLPLFVLTLYLLFWTRVPYVWPTPAFVVFVFLFVKGLVRYWQNSLTTYYVTDDRVISEYRFIKLKRTSTNVPDGENVEIRRSVIGTLTALGTVTVILPSANVRLGDLARPHEAEQTLRSLSR